MKSRRWFRFSLRKMFVLLTVCGIALSWLGVQMKWIRDRRTMLTQYQQHHYPRVGALPAGSIRAPWSIHLLGERGYSAVIITADSSHLSPEDRRMMSELERLFPEAQILAIPYR